MKEHFWAGVRAELPILIGVFPFGLIYGALALNVGLSRAASQLMSAIVFGGASQLVTTQLVHDAAPGALIVLSIAVVNLRHMLYSVSLAPYLAALSMRWKLVLSYLLTDEAYAPSIMQYEREGLQPFSHWFLFGAGTVLWTTWQLSTALGIFLGAVIPPSWPLDFALPLTFIAIVVPAIRTRPAVAAALVAGGVALAANSLPFKLGLIVAALAGIATGTWLELRSGSQQTEKRPSTSGR